VNVVKRIFSLPLVFSVFVSFLAVATLSAQDSEGQVFAPFVSRLDVMPQGEEVAITWRDSPDLGGGYQVLRSTEPISADNYLRARVAGRVAPGQESFLDRPGVAGEYYYAVAAELQTGAIYPIFIPFRNTTAQPVTVEPGPPPEERAASVNRIEAEPEEDSVGITFSASKAGRNLVVYRSIRALDSLETVTEATRLATLPSTEESFVDYPVPGVDYYYGVFDSELVALGLLSFDPGQNVTADAVGLPLSAPRQPAPEILRRTMRRRPLPLLSIDREIETGNMLGTQRQPPLPQPQELSPETVAALGPLRGSQNGDPPEEPQLVVLPEERVSASKGPAFTLVTIVNGSLGRRNWAEGQELLENFRTLPLDDEIAARVSFYLGQCHFFQGEYRTAFLEFLLARDHYFSATDPWLDAVLARLDQ
jgi:hypothetical protein